MSDDEPPEDVSKTELWNRMRRLEKKVFPNRRDLLKAGAVGAAGAAVGFGSGTASAQTASGQVGTSSKPVDVEAATVNAEKGASNVLNASPGEVQSKIDSATGTSGESVVRLDSGATYDPSSPWAVKQNVTLDFNGADVVLSTDIDVLHVYPGGLVEGPGTIDYSGVTYSSRVIVYDTAFSGQYNGDPGLTAGVSGLEISGTTGQGTVVHVLESQGTGLYFTRTDVSTYHVGTVARFEVSADGGSCNSNVVTGDHEHFETAVEHLDTSTNGGAVNGNVAGDPSAAWQPNTSGSSIRLWDLQAGAGNSVMGKIWDRADYTQETWRIGSGSGNENKIISSQHGLSQGDITDNANDPTNSVTSPEYTAYDPLQKVVAIGPSQTLGSGLTDSVVLGMKADVSSGDNATVVGSETTGNANEAVSIGYLTSVNSARVSKIQGSRGDGIVLPASAGGNQTTELENGTITFELDETNNNLVFEVQKSGGTRLSGTVSLS